MSGRGIPFVFDRLSEIRDELHLYGFRLDPRPGTSYVADGYSSSESIGMSGIELNAIVAASGHGVGAYSFLTGTVPSQVSYPVGFITNCSDPVNQLTCMQSWDPPGASQSQVSATRVHVERVGVIK